MTERTRINWKAKYEALAVEYDRQTNDLTETQAKNRELEALVKSANQVMDALKRDIERARLIGARDLASIMLDGGDNG